MWCTPSGLRKERKGKRERQNRLLTQPLTHTKRMQGSGYTWPFAMRFANNFKILHLASSRPPPTQGIYRRQAPGRRHVQYNTYVRKRNVQLGLWPVMVAQSKGKERTTCPHQAPILQRPIHVAMCWKYRVRHFPSGSLQSKFGTSSIFPFGPRNSKI